MDKLLAGLIGFIVGSSSSKRRSVTVHRIRRANRRIRRAKNPVKETCCQFCGQVIQPLASRKKKPLLLAYKLHLQCCPAIIPVEVTQCDCGISPLKNVAETQQDSDQK